MRALIPTIATLAVSVHAGTKPQIVRVEHQIRQVEGWNVHGDVGLLESKLKPTGDLALRIMAERLHQIILRLPAGPVAK